MRGLSIIGAFAIGAMLAPVSAFAAAGTPPVITPPNSGISTGVNNRNKCLNSTVQHPVKGCPPPKPVSG